MKSILKILKYKDFLLIFLTLIMISTLFIISGCKTNKDLDSKEKDPAKNKEEEVEKIKAPISLDGEVFSTIYGWLSDHEIIYSTEVGQGGTIYSYDLIDGKKELLYKTEVPIVTVKISPSKKWILIHSSQSTYKGIVSVIDKKGNSYFSKEIESTEIGLEWNIYDDNLLLLSAFKEDWSYNTYLLSMSNQTLQEIKMVEPFAFWLSKEELLYLDWDNEKPTLLAPLMKMGIHDEESVEMLSSIFHVSTFHGMLVTISVNDEDNEEALYTFYTNDFKKVHTIVIPQITRYSDWLIPYHDYIEKSNQFITLQPIKSGDIETYKDGFQLVSYHLDKKEKEVLFDHLKNEPISCSPSGNLCLYGNSFEKLINLNSREIIQLVKGSL